MGYKMKGSTFYGKSPLKAKKKTSSTQDKKKIIAGEGTGVVKADKKGKKYAIQGAGSPNWPSPHAAPGDTIFAGDKSHLISSLPKDHPAKGANDYIMGGDYTIEETKSSKKRTKGPKSYTTKKMQ